MPYLPSEIYSDQGKEFESNQMREYFKQRGIEKFASRTGDVKAAVAERFIKTMKHKMYKWFSEKNRLRWIEVLPKILSAMNETVNSATGMKPNNVNPENAGELWDKLYRRYLFPAENGTSPKTKYQKGSDVRLAKKRRTFEKGYLANFTGLNKQLLKNIFQMKFLKLTRQEVPNPSIIIF